MADLDVQSMRIEPGTETGYLSFLAFKLLPKIGQRVHLLALTLRTEVSAYLRKAKDPSPSIRAEIVDKEGCLGLPSMPDWNERRKRIRHALLARALTGCTRLKMNKLVGSVSAWNRVTPAELSQPPSTPIFSAINRLGSTVEEVDLNAEAEKLAGSPHDKVSLVIGVFPACRSLRLPSVTLENGRGTAGAPS